MAQDSQIFHASQRNERSFNWGYLAALVFVITGLYTGLRLVFNAPTIIKGPEISLAPAALPWYLLVSTGRMDGFESAYPRELSGGMRQKAGFARAMAVEPELLCLTEAAELLGFALAAEHAARRRGPPA